jgi:hypothetical protein
MRLWRACSLCWTLQTFRGRSHSFSALTGVLTPSCSTVLSYSGLFPALICQQLSPLRNDASSHSQLKIYRHLQHEEVEKVFAARSEERGLQTRVHISTMLASSRSMKHKGNIRLCVSCQKTKSDQSINFVRLLTIRIKQQDRVSTKATCSSTSRRHPVFLTCS